MQIKVIKSHFNRLLLIGDKYHIQDLVTVCEHELTKNLTLENAIETLKVADLTGAKHLKDQASVFIFANIKALRGTPKWKEVIQPDPELLSAILNNVG